MSSDVNPWDQGDYPEVAARLDGAAAALAEYAGPGDGRSAVDVAAGTGNVAIKLAAAGWRVAATDGSERMVELGRAATDATGHDVAWHRADLAHQPVEPATQDLVTSSFGVIFAADPDAVIDEIRRILTPGGQLLLTTWAEGGYMTAMGELMQAFMPPADDPPQRPRWGSPAYLEELLDGRFASVEIEERTLPWTFPSAGEGRAWLERVSPAHIASMAAAGQRAAEMMDAVEEHLADHADHGGQVAVDAEYLLVRAR